MDLLELFYFGVLRRNYAAMSEEERAQHFRRELILGVAAVIALVVITLGLTVYLRRLHP